MSNATIIKNDIAPLLEAVEKYHDYNHENELLDSEESNFTVCFQKGEEAPVYLAKPSLALFHGDPNLYEQEGRQLRLEKFAEVLEPEKFPRNQSNFNDLLKVQRANKITPFIGAGASISAGCQSWSNYLENKAKEVNVEEGVIEEHLNQNKFEDLLELIKAQPNGQAFDFYFQQDFEHADPESSYVWNFPELFNGCVITTNFDRVIEDCFQRQGAAFTEKTVGLNNPHTFIKAITRGERYLLKLHGNIDNPEHRVFTKEEYQRAYSTNDELVDMSFPLPQLLTHLYRSHSFLFVGCSLEIDRTVKTFELIFEQPDEDRSKIADHFAIIECPDDQDQFQELEQRLMRCNIKPIWFENGSFEKVDEIIDLLKV